MNDTISCYSSLIFLQNFFCINRTFLLRNKIQRLLAYIINLLVIFVTITAFVYHTFEAKVDELMFQGILAIELVLIILGTYRKNTFKVLDRLDGKCCVDKKFASVLERKVRKETVIAIASIVVDVIGMYMLEVKLPGILTYVVMLAAHETEAVLYSLVIEGMNLRLIELSDVNPSAGSRVYRHVLMASSQMNIENTPKMVMFGNFLKPMKENDAELTIRSLTSLHLFLPHYWLMVLWIQSCITSPFIVILMVIIMLGVVLFTTISYSCIILLMNSDKGMTVTVYLLWRELKSLYCVRCLCKAASNSDQICQQLAFQLSTKLAFDPNFDKAKRPVAHAIVKRWYNTVLRHRPRYVRGSVLSIGHSTPLHLLDLSVNYVLIIIQFYVAYK